MSVPEVIGEGAYGCVHKPSLVCDNKQLSYKKKISKIMLSKEAMKEFKEYAMISHIDKSNKYYVGMPTTCKVKPTTRAINAVNKCKHIKKKYFKKGTVKQGLSKMLLLVMNDGGRDLKYHASLFRKMQDTAETREKVRTFWVESLRFFRGIQTFQKYGIVHHDIKPQNLVYNAEAGRANFIDFGHMRNIAAEIEKCEQSDNWIYDYPFWNYPFEIQFLNKVEYMDFVNKSPKEKEHFINKFAEDLNRNQDTKFVNAFRIFMEYMSHGKSKSNTIRICNKYISDFRETVMNQMKSYEDFVKSSITSIDIYGLGMSLQYILSYTQRFMDRELVTSLENCFYRMTTANMEKRYSTEESMSVFETALMNAGYFQNTKHTSR